MRSKISSTSGPDRWEETISGLVVHVITGYDISSNRYPVHVIVKLTDGKKREFLRVGLAESEQEGIEFGFKHARALIAAGELTGPGGLPF